jgi:hypothetical protein
MYADLLLERRIFGSFEVVVLSMIDLSALHDFGGCAMLDLGTYLSVLQFWIYKKLADVILLSAVKSLYG